MSDDSEKPAPKLDFIREIISNDLESGKHPHIVTRFPPEPNGYLHIGHAKAFCLVFGVAEEFAADGKSRCHLRMDDTNPTKEDEEYVASIQEDIRWMGFDWGEHFYYASDYYERLYGFAVELIEKGLAYVDSQSPEEIRANRGTVTEPGTESPHRDREVEESLNLFQSMRAGEFKEGEQVLRAKIDMASPNMHLRDPVIYRILHTEHDRTGSTWCIYPMYDFAHPLSDALEEITHSLCSLEFEEHRPLYDWFVDNCSVPAVPRQIEFARLTLSYTITSKRKLLQLVEEDLVDGWDDPRMPTLSGMRRRGYPPAAIRSFCQTIGMTKTNSLTDFALLEHAVRSELNTTAHRYMAVLDPLKVTLTNYPEGKEEMLEGPLNPEDESAGTRQIPFTGEFYIERDDFREEANRKFFRLKTGGEVRLRYSYIVKCEEVVKDEDGEIIELKCSVDLDTLGKNPEDRKVKGVIHWVSSAHAHEAEVRLYDRLFAEENPGAGGSDFLKQLNPDSLSVLANCKLEPGLAEAVPGQPYQFERLGYFTPDSRLSEPGAPVFNRASALRDSWGKKGG